MIPCVISALMLRFAESGHLNVDTPSLFVVK